MDFSDRIPNIAAVHFRMGKGSYARLNRQIHGMLPVIKESRAREIEAATGGLIKWWEIYQPKAQGSSPKEAA